MRKSYLTLFLLFSAGVSTMAVAETQQATATSTPASLESTSCWDFTTEDHDGRGLILMLHYGYVIGRYRSGEIVADQVEPTLRRVALACRDNPDLPLVEAFKQSLAGTDGK